MFRSVFLVDPFTEFIGEGEHSALTGAGMNAPGWISWTMPDRAVPATAGFPGGDLPARDRPDAERVHGLPEPLQLVYEAETSPCRR